MSQPEHKPTYFFAGLLAILVVYTCDNLFFQERWFYTSLSRVLRHVVKFGCILLVYEVGYLVFKRYVSDWLLSIWRLLYVVCTILLLAIGIYDGLVREMAPSLRYFAVTLHEFLISPAPYVVVVLLNKRRG
jgi:hypothetical protein